jgi:CheY-like chemotaxis protein
MNRIAGGSVYDLLLLDNDLPGVSGIEITRYARHLAVYRSTPIAMLSASDCEAEARQAGVNAFLLKPDDAGLIVATISRLLADSPGAR